MLTSEVINPIGAQMSLKALCGPGQMSASLVLWVAATVRKQLTLRKSSGLCEE